jgi:PiT family inorganic phosphate transporter
LVEIDSPQGMAAESASAATILISSHFGYSLSTTHVATGSILGTGLGRTGAEVRWRVAGRMLIAWLVTLPIAAVVGAVAYGLANWIGGTAGAVLVFVVLLVASGAMYLASRKSRVHPGNVNDDWDSSDARADAASVRA